MNTTLWYCETCNKSMNRTSKSRHLRTQAHLAKCSTPTATTKDCDVCYEPQPTKKFKKCTQCVNTWCGTCHQKMDKCPFCRVEIEGAQRRSYVWNPTPEEFPMFYVDFNPEPANIESPEPLHARQPNRAFIQWVINSEYQEEFQSEYAAQLDRMLDYFTLNQWTEPVPYRSRMDLIA